MTPLLRIENLSVTFATRAGPVEALRGIDPHPRGWADAGHRGRERIGQVGYGIRDDAAPRPGRAHRRRAHPVQGPDVSRLSGKEMQALHGAAISMIFRTPARP